MFFFKMFEGFLNDYIRSRRKGEEVSMHVLWYFPLNQVLPQESCQCHAHPPTCV